MKTILTSFTSLGRWAAILSLGVLCSCATKNREQTYSWLKDNQRIGTIRQHQFPGGFNYQYVDLVGRTVRTERRDASRQLCPGACTVVFEFDAAGRVMAVRNLDASERPCMGAEGWATSRRAYFYGADSAPIEARSFFDDQDQPTIIKFGYAEARYTKDVGGKLKKIQFLDLSHLPAAATWQGTANVAEVQYSYLQGVTEVTCVAILDAGGNVLRRQMVNGQTESTFTASSYNSSVGSGVAVRR
jgi:hypothetical protein